MRKLFIDADACPVIEEALAVAHSTDVPVVLVGNYTQNLHRLREEPGVSVVEVEPERDEADFVIVSMIGVGDVLVSNDTGLAAIVLGKGGVVMTPRGKIFREETIDRELHARHEARVARRRGGRTKGPSPFTREDRKRFQDTLERVLITTAQPDKR